MKLEDCARRPATGRRVAVGLAWALFSSATLPVAASAVVYDAFASFNAIQGSGNFVYGESLNNVFTAFGRNTSCTIPGTICLESVTFNNALVAKSSNGAFPFSTINVPADALVAHPSAGTAAVVLAFVAPAAGTYNFQARFFTADVRPSGVSLFRFGPAQLTPLGGVSAASPSLTNSGTITLATGQAFGFALNNGGNYLNDSTGFNFTVAQAGVPEPQAWLAMVSGLFLSGSLIRRRRSQSAERPHRVLA